MLSDHSSKLTTVWQFGHLAEARSGMADIRSSPFLAIELKNNSLTLALIWINARPFLEKPVRQYQQ
jgi:hypothetical protein